MCRFTSAWRRIRRLELDCTVSVSTDGSTSTTAAANFARALALYEELVHFFRGLGRNDLAKAVEAQRRMINLAVSRIETRIDKLDLEAAIETCLPDRQATLGESFTNSPASAASTPAR